MNSKFDDFSDLLNENLEIKSNRNPFNITQIKLEYYHFMSGDIDFGTPTTTSIELVAEYDFNRQKMIWNKIVSHSYYGFNSNYSQETITYKEEIDNSIIEQLEKIDLRNLKNNYFTDSNPQRFSHFELNYNYFFKIVWTKDQELDELSQIIEILDFDNIIKEEIRKVNEKMKSR
ncbi:MAG: hypothetical protein IJ572_02840 [Bacilli bacterium]|nr:hypothetical protein [Bacilli bacterium]